MMEGNELKQALRAINCDLDKSLGTLSNYRALSPKIELFVGLMGMLQGMATELSDSASDILTELSQLPDNFSEVLNHVNLTVSKNKDIVSITYVPKEDGLSMEHSATVSDTNFVCAMLKVYSRIIGDTAMTKTRYFHKRMSGTNTGKGFETAVTFPTDMNTYLLFQSHGTEEEYPIGGLEAGSSIRSLCKVVSIDREEGVLKLDWLVPFFGNLYVVGDSEDDNGKNS
ncbi:hypothetical protein BN7874_110 [Phage NCTB]|nr:hypothetical protein BN7874_110 [Phage NCTB]